MEKQVEARSYKKVFMYGSSFVDGVEENIIHIQFIGQCDEYVLVHSYVMEENGDEYDRWQIFDYDNADTSNERYVEVDLGKLITRW